MTSEVIPTLSGRQINIRRRSAVARDARNTLVGLCLTWQIIIPLRFKDIFLCIGQLNKDISQARNIYIHTEYKVQV